MARRKSSKKASVAQVHSIVKKEVNKTRETNKLVSYIGWSRLNDILTTTYPPSPNLPEPQDAICVYSLTGGVSATIDATQDPNEYISKNLFVLLPTDTFNAGNLSGVGQAQQAGTSNQIDSSGGAGAGSLNTSIANPHQLEGRQAFLKKFYASVVLNNSGSSVVDPTNVLVRAMIVETRRPLSSSQIAKQILL